MTTLSDIVTRVADECKVSSARSGVSDRIKRETNRICQEIWDGFRWSFRWRNYRIVTTVDVTAGTVAATNDSRTITGSGTSFTSSHVGRHVYFPGDSVSNWYKVRAYTSATEIELDVPYQGTTGGSKSYVIRQFDYVLPTEPWDLGSVIVTSERRPVHIVESTSMDLLAPAPTYKGYPTAVAIYSSDSPATTYTTGTVSGTIDTTTLTGVGTAWLDNVHPGDKVTIDTNVYTVRMVDSDTQISLYNKQQVTSSGATYTITRQFGRIIRVMWPSSENHVIDIRALRKYSNLVNDDDTNELLYRYPHAIILKVSALELKSQNDKRAALNGEEAELALLRAKADDESLTHRDNVPAIYSYRSTGGRERYVS